MKKHPAGRCARCGVDFGEFPELAHPFEDCDGPECTCYEIIGGHQPGCPHYRSGRKPFAIADVMSWPLLCQQVCGAGLQWAILYEHVDQWPPAGLEEKLADPPALG